MTRLTDSPRNRLIRSAIAMIEAQDLSHWSDSHDKVTLDALREYLAVWGDHEPESPALQPGERQG